MARNVFNPIEGRRHEEQMLSYIRKPFDHTVGEGVFLVGKIPDNSIILSIRVHVEGQFAGKKLKFGSTEAVNDYGEADVGQVGIVNVTIPNSKWFVSGDELLLRASLDGRVQNGKGTIIVEFICKEDSCPVYASVAGA